MRGDSTIESRGAEKRNEAGRDKEESRPGCSAVGTMISMNGLTVWGCVPGSEWRLAGRTWTESSSSSAKCASESHTPQYHTLLLQQTGSPVTNPDSHFNTLSLIFLSQQHSVFP